VSQRVQHLCPANNAHAALSEATRALTIAHDATPAHRAIGAPTCRMLAADIAANLDALSRLLRASGLGAVPISADAHNLYALVQHLGLGVTMARRAAGDDGDGIGPGSTPGRGTDATGGTRA
jgi:hypothetical protein